VTRPFCYGSGGETRTHNQRINSPLRSDATKSMAVRKGPSTRPFAFAAVCSVTGHLAAKRVLAASYDLLPAASRRKTDRATCLITRERPLTQDLALFVHSPRVKQARRRQSHSLGWCFRHELCTTQDRLFTVRGLALRRWGWVMPASRELTGVGLAHAQGDRPPRLL
jgi:hypothetical protein